MNKGSKDTIKRQTRVIVSGYLLILVLLGFTTQIALDNFKSLNDNLRQVVQHNNVKAQHMLKMRDAILQRILALYQASQQTDPFEVDETIQKYNMMARQFIVAREELDKMDLTENQKFQLEQQRKVLTEAQAILDKVIEKIRSEKSDQIGQLLLTAQQMNRRAVEQLQQMVDLQNRIAEDSVKRSEQAMVQARSRIFILIGFTVLFTSIVLFIIITIIRRQGKAVSSLLDQLSDANNELEQKVEVRTRELMSSREENMRMSAELNVAHQLQQVLLPKKAELEQIPALEIAASMAPAEEAGGDYFDVLQYDNKVIFGIGDVTGHGLESSIVMLMTQAAVRALAAEGQASPKKLITTLNRAIYDNIQRMESYKNLTLLIGYYQNNQLLVSGQHEDILLIRKQSNQVEKIDTLDFGFPIGLEADIETFTQNYQIELNGGDTLLFYTDGITEAENESGEFYGSERLAEQFKAVANHSVQQIHDHIISDIRQFIGNHRVYDDITLLIIRQK